MMNTKVITESIEVTIKRIGNVSANIYLLGNEGEGGGGGHYEENGECASAYLIIAILILCLALVLLKKLEYGLE